MVSNEQYAEILADRNLGENVLCHFYRAIKEKDALKAEVERLKQERNGIVAQAHPLRSASYSELAAACSKYREDLNALEAQVMRAEAILCRVWRAHHEVAFLACEDECALLEYQRDYPTDWDTSERR